MEINQHVFNGIIQSVPGDFAFYRIIDGKFNIVYMSPQLATLSGMTTAEYVAKAGQDAIVMVVSGDRDYVTSSINSCMEGRHDADLTYRIYHKKNGFIWIHAKMRIIGTWLGNPLLMVIFQNTSAETEKFADIIDHFNGIIYVIDEKSHELLYANDLALQGVAADVVDYSSHKCYELFCQRNSPCPWCSVPKIVQRRFHGDMCYVEHFDKWFRIDCYAIQWFGHDAVVIYAVDVTEQQRKRQDLEFDKSALQEIINNLPVGVGVQLFKDGQTLLHIENTHTRELLGLPKGYKDEQKYSLARQIHADDRPAIHTFEQQLHLPGQHLMEVFRFYRQGSDQPCWYQLEARTIERSDGVMAFSCLSDITAKMEGEIQLRRSHIMYEMACEAIGLVVWQYDITTKSIHMMDSGYTKILCHQMRLPLVIENGPEWLAPYVMAPYREKFLRMYREIDQGAAKASCSFWSHTIQLQEPRYYQIRCQAVFDEVSQVRTVYGIAMDMTMQQLEKEKYARMYRKLAEESVDSLGTFQVNLTKNWCGNGKSSDPIVLTLQADGTVDGLLQRIAAAIPDESIRRAFAAQYTCSSAIEAFRNGKTQLAAEFPICLRSSEVQWIQAFLNMVQNPVTGDIEGLTNSVYITERKKTEAIIDVITREMFDYIGILNVQMHTFEYQNIQQSIPDMKPRQKVDCEEWRIHVRDLFINQQEWQHFDRCTALENLETELNDKGEYAFSYQYTENGGTTLRQIQYNWLNQQTGDILVIQSDITAAYEQEQQRLRQTQAALEAAEQANRAKNDFVSRISHDIRTPISAISNMTEFALEDMGDTVRLRHDLENIRTSNAFLLSLINDVLDISKIDSGKIELNPEVYPYTEYMDHIRNMFEPLCAQKGVAFIVSPRLQHVGTMVADKIRINQIILNIISNAVKYTPAGGIVTYTSYSRNLPDNRIIFAFSVTDTGIGMSEAFQQRMFESFTQEHDNPLRPQGLSGTGLGLSIVKHIVDLMGGTLTVQSQMGQGTCVHCEIPFPDADRDPAYAVKEHAVQPNTDLPAALRGRVLLVEDNEINTEIAKRILENFGLTVVHAENGERAVAVFSTSPVGGFDCILMDIQMPLLNGYEATERIRALPRPDAVTIPILAMTADAFAEAVEHCRRVGMNQHITKPLDPLQLRHTLEQFLENDN